MLEIAPPQILDQETDIVSNTQDSLIHEIVGLSRLQSAISQRATKEGSLEDYNLDDQGITLPPINASNEEALLELLSNGINSQVSIDLSAISLPTLDATYDIDGNGLSTNELQSGIDSLRESNQLKYEYLDPNTADSIDQILVQAEGIIQQSGLIKRAVDSIEDDEINQLVEAITPLLEQVNELLEGKSLYFNDDIYLDLASTIKPKVKNEIIESITLGPITIADFRFR